jgi:AraC-like DNA-binding protein
MGEGESVLVIADEENHPFYKALRIGQAHVTITSCERAVAVLREGGVGLLILDSGDEAEKGLPILSGLKQAFPSVPVIFLAAVTNEELAIRAFRAGARDYFKKPATLSEIEQSVITLLRLRRSCTEARESLMIRYSENTAMDDQKLRPNLPVGLARAICSMHEQLAGSLRLDAVAKEAGMSKYHFCRVFKQYCGMSPMQFLRWLRVEQAKQLLATPGLKVSSVAFSVGFNDIGEFNRQFKKVTGFSPSRFRASFQREG